MVFQRTRTLPTNQGRNRDTPKGPKCRHVHTIVLAGLGQALLWPVGVTFDLVEEGLHSCRLEESLDLGGGEVGDAFDVSFWLVLTLPLSTSLSLHMASQVM